MLDIQAVQVLLDIQVVPAELKFILTVRYLVHIHQLTLSD